MHYMQISKWVYGDEVCRGTILLIDSQFCLAAASQQGVLMKATHVSPNQLENISGRQTRFCMQCHPS